MSKLQKILLVIYIFILAIMIPGIKSNAASTFCVKFVDVGQGDCSIIECDGHYMIIDGGDSKASSTIYSILKKDEIKNIDVMIATHPDADHIGGLAGALNYAKVSKCYCSVAKYDIETFGNLTKYFNKQGLEMTLPKAGESFKLGSARVDILGPISAASDTNNSSIVVRVTYGSTAFLFTGDAETSEEQEIIKANKDIQCDVIKVGHHGSASSSSKEFLKAVNPKYAIISVGKDNSYGHPDSTTLDKLKSVGAKVYRTDMQGDIIVSSNGKKLTITTEKNVDDSKLNETNKVEIPVGTTYVLNTNSKKIHKPTCSSVNQMKAKNRSYSSESLETLKQKGYKPCGNCKP